MNIFDYLKAKKQNIANKQKPVIYQSNPNLHGIKGTAVRSIATLATISVLFGNMIACSPLKQEELPEDNNPGISAPSDNPSTNIPNIPQKDPITNSPSTNNPTDETITEQDHRPELVDRIESTLAQRFGVNDLELQSIGTQLDNGSVVHKNLNGQNVIFVNFLVDVDNNIHTLTLPVEMNTYLDSARKINPATTAIYLTKNDLLSINANKTAVVTELVDSACNPTPQMGQ